LPTWSNRSIGSVSGTTQCVTVMQPGVDLLGCSALDASGRRLPHLKFAPGRNTVWTRTFAPDQAQSALKEEITMKWIMSVIALALTVLAPVASAQTTKPDVSSAPSAQSSGAGIPGQPGSKSGPAVKPGETVGSSSATDQQNPTVQLQDPSNIKGLPGNKSGPPAKQPPRQ
jgi:hypothetical protein